MSLMVKESPLKIAKMYNRHSAGKQLIYTHPGRFSKYKLINIFAAKFTQ